MANNRRTAKSRVELRRRPRPLRVRVAARLLLYLVLVPLSYLLRIFGVWPNLLARVPNRMATFGNYRPAQCDVVVASFFKSGTNWTMQIAQQVAHYGHAEFEHIHDLVPWPEVPQEAAFAVSPQDLTAAERSPTGLRIIKTHLPLGNVPYVSSARYICVVRDPKDVLISSYFFLKRVGFGPLMPSMEEWKRLSLSDSPLLGSWSRHLNSYWRVKDRENILFLRYEELLNDLPGGVTKIAEFMGVQLTAEQLALVVEKSSFEYMKRSGHKFDPTGIGAPWASPAGAMVRRGRSGGSLEYLSKPDRDEIDKHWRRALQAAGSDFPYDEYYASEPATD